MSRARVPCAPCVRTLRQKKNGTKMLKQHNRNMYIISMGHRWAGGRARAERFFLCVWAKWGTLCGIESFFVVFFGRAQWSSNANSFCWFFCVSASRVSTLCKYWRVAPALTLEAFACVCVDSVPLGWLKGHQQGATIIRIAIMSGFSFAHVLMYMCCIIYNITYVWMSYGSAGERMHSRAYKYST